MSLAFPVLILVASTLCVPAWLVARGRSRGSVRPLFLSFPAVAIWVAMEGAGLGNIASLSNLIEVFWLLGAGIVLAYAKVFALDRVVRRWRLSTYGAIVLLAVAAILLRLYMPTLPE